MDKADAMRERRAIRESGTRNEDSAARDQLGGAREAPDDVSGASQPYDGSTTVGSRVSGERSPELVEWSLIAPSHGAEAVPGSARIDGYAPIRDHAVIGDGRTAALVARTGRSIGCVCLTWIRRACSQRFWTPSLAAGSSLRPESPFTAEHRYERDASVLQTTFATAQGVVRVTDAMLLPASGLAPMRELLRRVEGLADRVTMRWRMEPRFDASTQPIRVRAGRIGSRWCRKRAAVPAVPCIGSTDASPTPKLAAAVLEACHEVQRRRRPQSS